MRGRMPEWRKRRRKRRREFGTRSGEEGGGRRWLRWFLTLEKFHMAIIILVVLDLLLVFAELIVALIVSQARTVSLSRLVQPLSLLFLDYRQQASIQKSSTIYSSKSSLSIPKNTFAPPHVCYVQISQERCWNWDCSQPISPSSPFSPSRSSGRIGDGE
ncbi:hypothetical protein BDY24DRAFT_65448 [Mrakia frigida]|uniref:uncharacterized protein n=1 Tax=Mrakia frigida TaxID=29902 RepID=UPI003FCC06D3